MRESSRSSRVCASGESRFTAGCEVRSPPVSRRDFLLGSSALIAGLLVRGSLVNAQQGGHVRVGFIVSGVTEEIRQTESLIAGFDLFLKERGGTARFEILKKHGGEKDEKTPEALAEILVKDEVPFLIGPTSQAGSEKCIQGLATGKAILFLTNPSVRLVGGELCATSAFRVRANTFQSSKPISAWALKNLGMRAFITGHDDSQGNEEADFFAYGFDRSGGMFVDRIMSAPGSQEFDPILEAIGSSKADFTFASFRGKDAAAFLKKYRSSRAAPRQPVIGPESLTTFPEPLKGCGKACLGVKTLTTLKDPVAFTERIRRHTGLEIPDAARAAEGYDIAQIIYEVSGGLTRVPTETAELIKSIEQIEIDGPRGKIRFENNHEPIVDVRVQEWEISGKALRPKTVAELGTCLSLDFGCGRVGFPKKPLAEQEEEPEGEKDQQ